MRVLIDDQIATSQTQGGISRYFAELTREFVSNPTLGVQVAVPRYVRSMHYFTVGVGRPLPGPFGRHALSLRTANRALSLPRGCGHDIVHHTYYDAAYIRRYAGSPLRVTTIVDMIPELFPGLFPHGNPHINKRDFVATADLILCISESTKHDLIRVYGPQRAPIVVTPLGVDQTFFPDRPRVAALPDKYVLHVGSRGGYKDFLVLAKAFAQSALPTGDTVLVAVGGKAFSRAESNEFRRLGIQERVRQIYLTDDEVAGAYAHAICFVYPSRYEGFGLPTLEAMASGCPTILARSSSHPEVGGDAAMYFPPGDVDALAGALDHVTQDTDQRRAMRAAGLGRAAGFTWQRTAELTARAYASLGRC